METSLKTGFAQIFSSCPKNLSCPNSPPPARTPMSLLRGLFPYLAHCCREILIFTTFLVGYFFTKTVISNKKTLFPYANQGKNF